MGDKKKDSIFKKMFPGFYEHEKEPATLSTIGTSGIMGGGYTGGGYDPLLGKLATSALPSANSDDPRDAFYFDAKLPFDRIQRYHIFRHMNMDSTISTALRHHIINALATKEGSNEVAYIEVTSDSKKNQVYVDHLRKKFKDVINKHSHAIAYNMALNGTEFTRLYYNNYGIIPSRMLRNFYTHPGNMTIWEQGGNIAGYTNYYQYRVPSHTAELMPPWKWGMFKIPLWDTDILLEPISVMKNGKMFDIFDDNPNNAPIMEAQDYGQSILCKSYTDWYNFMEAITSLCLTRKNLARVERIWGVQTGGMNPQAAQEYLNIVAKQLVKTNEANTRQSLRHGAIQTIINHLIPVWSKDGKGKLEVSSLEPSPNVSHIEDVMMHLRRLCASMGSSPSLLGFEGELAAGLGEGSWSRLSIMSALFSMLIRVGLALGWYAIFDMEIAFAFGKYFPAGNKPWKLVFNAANSALEREMMENLTERVNIGTAYVGLKDMVDPENQITDHKVFVNHVFTDLLKQEEELVNRIFGKKPNKETSKEEMEQ